MTITPYYTPYSCPSPTNGCGSNYYWDSGICSCKSSAGSNPSVMPIITSYKLPEKIDRLGYENEYRIACVKALLSPSEYEKLRYVMPSLPQEYEEINKLSEKVKKCWNYSLNKQNTTYGRTAEAQLVQLPIEKEECLKKSLGEDTFKEIYEGKRKPKYEEHLLFEKCYGKVEPEKIVYSTNQEELPDQTGKCLRSALKEKYDDIKAGTSDVPLELRNEVDKCFGIEPKPFKEVKRYEIPDKIKSCLLQAVGQVRFDEINSGKSGPSEGEKNKGTACFAQLNTEQTKFLPPPAEQVPFIDEKSEVIQVAEVKQETKTTEDKTHGGKVTFAGKGPPSSVVTIYIYSEPIVVTTKTDENGDWIYELDKPLEGEKHVAYAAVRSSDGALVRSSVFNFTVVAAEQDTQQRFVEESRVSDTTEKGFVLRAIFILVIVVIVLLILSLQLYSYLRKRSNT